MNNILVVDDHSFFSTYLSHNLSEKEYHIDSVREPDEALRRIEESKPDIVLLDLFLNGFEGWDLLRDIKDHDPHLPVIIISTYDSFRYDPRSALADGYVLKDVMTDTLKEKIKELLHQAP